MQVSKIRPYRNKFFSNRLNSILFSTVILTSKKRNASVVARRNVTIRRNNADAHIYVLSTTVHIIRSAYKWRFPGVTLFSETSYQRSVSYHLISYDPETAVVKLILFASCPLWTLIDTDVIAAAMFFSNLYLTLCS